MPRGKRRIKKREITPDHKYQSVLLAKFINKVMLFGKKETARRLVYKTLDKLQKETGQNGLEVFEKAILNAKPILEVRPRRIGGATYLIPREVPERRGQSLAMRFIIDIVRARQGKSFDQFLFEELLSAYQGTGEAVKKKEELHRLAEANKAFAHFARF